MRAGDRLRIVVGGFLGQFHAGGAAWDYVQYPVGLAALGHDVWYLEDTGLWPTFQPAQYEADDAAPTLRRLHSILDRFGLGDRWALRDEVKGEWHGLDDRTRAQVLGTADVFLNVSCSTVLRDELRAIPVRVLLDTDPMFTQVQIVQGRSLTAGGDGMRSALDEHSHHATFGERIGAADCLVPTCGVEWLPTRQPICLDQWPVAPPPRDVTFSTVMNWSATPPLHYGGRCWGQKDEAVLALRPLARSVGDLRLELTIGNATGAPLRALAAAGWGVREAGAVVDGLDSYRRYIQQSTGELGITKPTYVQARTGWFSCRSACYLASGRPVVAQDTGWTAHLPEGDGLVAFHDIDDAKTALERVARDHRTHAVAARAIAEEFFDARSVLPSLLDRVTR